MHKHISCPFILFQNPKLFWVWFIWWNAKAVFKPRCSPENWKWWSQVHFTWTRVKILIIMLNYIYSLPFCKNCAHNWFVVSSCNLKGTHTCIFDKHALLWMSLEMIPGRDMSIMANSTCLPIWSLTKQPLWDPSLQDLLFPNMEMLVLHLALNTCIPMHATFWSNIMMFNNNTNTLISLMITWALLLNSFHGSTIQVLYTNTCLNIWLLLSCRN